MMGRCAAGFRGLLDERVPRADPESGGDWPIPVSLDGALQILFSLGAISESSIRDTHACRSFIDTRMPAGRIPVILARIVGAPGDRSPCTE